MTPAEVLELARGLVARGYHYPFARDVYGRCCPFNSERARAWDVEDALLCAAAGDVTALLGAWALLDAVTGGSLSLWERQGRTQAEALQLLSTARRRAERSEEPQR